MAAELEAPGGRGKVGCLEDAGAGYLKGLEVDEGGGLWGLKILKGSTVGLSPPSAGLLRNISSSGRP